MARWRLIPANGPLNGLTDVARRGLGSLGLFVQVRQLRERADRIKLAIPARRQPHRQVLELAQVHVDRERLVVRLHHRDRTGKLTSTFEQLPQPVVDVTHDRSVRAWPTDGREDGGVKRSTAIGHLVEMGEVATERLRLRDTDIGWPLEELWVTGDLLSLADTLESGSVVLVLDLPAEELPWLALHPVGEWVGDQLRLGKRPLRWCYRPLAWPVWNHDHQRLVRFWTASGSVDTDVIEALRSRRLDRLAVVEPSAHELVPQLREEVAVSRRHLRAVLDSYWDRSWRHEHEGYDDSPEDHLWRAATAVEDMLEALDDRS